LTELNGGALFDAEFGIGHGATPYRKGQVLHSVFAAAGSQDERGAWHAIELTNLERKSVTLSAVSNCSDERLPEGWSCDLERNSFDLGLWGQQERKEWGANISDNSIFNCSIERVDCYIRVSPDAPLVSANLMARISVDGEVYATNLSEGNVDFESSVRIESITPYVLTVADLTEYRDESALIADGVHGVCYYWTPPAGLEFLYNGELSKTVRFSTEGEFFQTSYVFNSDGGVAYKGGVVVGKDSVGQSLNLSDVHHGSNYPAYNPAFNFNERPTIMRAICLVDQMPSLNEDSEGKWKMWDNYGNPHYFILVSTGPYSLRLKDVVEHQPQYAIESFRIFFTNGQTDASNLYANGRHQTKVEIELLKKEMGPDGNWIDSKLTEAEQLSLTVVGYSSNSSAQLPRGWSVDYVKNQFDTGLWVRGGASELPMESNTCVTADATGEAFSRYMRCDNSVPIEPQRFMAKIIVGGKIYTTYSYHGNSYISITPVKPYVLRPNDLHQIIHDPYYNRETRTAVDVYYWLPPSGVRFVDNKGFDSSLAIPNEGTRFQTCYARNSYQGIHSAKIGVITNSNEVNLAINLDSIHRNIPGESGSRGIIFNRGGRKN
jgi:hypothetical protein